MPTGVFYCLRHGCFRIGHGECLVGRCWEDESSCKVVGIGYLEKIAEDDHGCEFFPCPELCVTLDIDVTVTLELGDNGYYFLHYLGKFLDSSITVIQTFDKWRGMTVFKKKKREISLILRQIFKEDVPHIIDLIADMALIEEKKPLLSLTNVLKKKM